MANTVRFLRNLPISNKEMDDGDLLLIAQPDATTPSKYRTVNTNLISLFTLIKDTVVANGVHNLVYVKQENGLLGTGSKSDPIRLDEEVILEQIVPNNAVNLSQFGSMKEANLPITISGSGGKTTIEVTREFKCFFNGRVYVVEPRTVEYPLPPVGIKFLVYIVSNGSEVDFIGTTSPQAESVDSSLIAWAANVGETTTTVSKPFIRLDKYRISIDKVGSGIPLSNGFPFDPVFTRWE